MAGLGTSFNPNEVEPDKGGGNFVLAPEGPGEYEITESDVKPTKNGKGLVASFVFVGIGDDNKGAKLFKFINVQNESAQAQAIGQGELSALCRAADFTSELNDTNQLHYRPLWLEVKHEQRMKKGLSGKYDDPAFNDDGSPQMTAVVKRFLFEGCDDGAAKSDSPPASKPAAASAPPKQPEQKPATGARRPWDKK